MEIKIIIRGSAKQSLRDLENLALDAIADINSMDGGHTAFIEKEEKGLLTPYPEKHTKGVISIENIPQERMIKGDLGIHISVDGRVWVCINGIAFLRFREERKVDETLD